MFISEALLFGPEPQVRSTQPAPHIVVGITSSQTCLTLTGRLRALRLAGFRVTLVSSPGELLDRTAAREGVESVAIPMKREIAPPADIVSLVRLASNAAFCWRPSGLPHSARRLSYAIAKACVPKRLPWALRQRLSLICLEMAAAMGWM